MSRGHRARAPAPVSERGPKSELGRESARQAGDLAALRRMLEASRGCFSLSFAVCNDRGLRDQLIRQLTDADPGIALVALPPQTPDVLQAVKARLGTSTPAALFVLDLEASIPFDAAAYPTLRALNAAREAWQRLACPVVFWLADYAAARVAAQAPDLRRYRSHQFDFASEQATPDRALGESFPGFDMVDGLPFEERRFRMAELEQRLREAGDPPAPELLAHALDWLYELARLYEHANRFGEAEDLLRRGLGWAEGIRGPEDTGTATVINNLARLLHECDRLGEAEHLIRRALGIAERSYGQDNPAVAVYLNNLAQLLKETDRRAEAEPLMRRALAIDEQGHGSDHLAVARDINNLAQLLQDTNRQAEAEPLMRRALAIVEQSLGADHPGVAVYLNNLAALLQNTNRLAEAEPLMRRALAINECAHGPDHPAVAVALNNLAALLQYTHRLAEAEPLLLRALAIDEQAQGPDHPALAADLNNLARLFQVTNRLGEAEPLMRRALAILLDSSRRTGHPHPRLEMAIRNYSAQLAAQGKGQDEIATALAGLGLDGTSGA